MNAHDYVAYVASAYGLSALLLGVLAGWIAWNARAKRREIKHLEGQGFRRRSASTAP